MMSRSLLGGMLVVAILSTFLVTPSSSFSTNSQTSNELNHAADDEVSVVVSVEDVLDKLEKLEARLKKVEGENSQCQSRLGKVETDDLQYRTRLHKVEEANLQCKARLDKVEEEKLQYQKTVKNLEEKVEYLEITRRDVPRSCHDIKKLGVSKSGKYLIDPDGSGHGDPPIRVDCNLNGTFGVTEVAHNTVGSTNVNPCGEPGCDVHPISYSATDKQIQALIGLSEDCSQSISYSCLSSPLKSAQRSMAWWVGSNGVRHHYWDGKHSATEHKCACATSKNCVNNSLSCNCDGNSPYWTSDTGTLKDQTALPVKQMNFGGLTRKGQQAKFELQPLKCSGRKALEPTQSCKALLQAGNTGSGYYLVDGPNGVNYDLIQCNMDLEPDDPKFQMPTLVKLAEYPVAFHSYMNAVAEFNTTGVIPYNSSFYVNDGNAMTPEGTFTAPLNGVYAFTFSTLKSKHVAESWVFIRVDGSEVARLHMHDIDEDAKKRVGYYDYIPGSMSTIVHLRRGQKVDAYLFRGAIWSIYSGFPASYTFFTGQLLYPTN